MEQKAGAQITIRAFMQSAFILLLLMIAAGVLTRMLPPGKFNPVQTPEPKTTVLESFTWIQPPDYPVWRWFLAPIEVLWGPDSLIIITILVFILFIGGAFAVLERGGIISAILGNLVKRFGRRKYLLLLVISFFFMFMGAFFGLFEEIVPLVPLMIALSYSLGWDALLGLGMSILATNIGFSAAITNPFTIGVAQRLAGLPLFSGILLRIPVFLVFYLILILFLTGYARRIDRNPQDSLLYHDDAPERAKYAQKDVAALAAQTNVSVQAIIWFAASLSLLVLILLASAFTPVLTEYSLPLIGLIFLIGGLGAGLMNDMGLKKILAAFSQGVAGIAPGIPLILMAASVKYIISQGGVMDTMIFYASQPLSQASPILAALIIYLLALFIEIFIASAGAKAVLMMPILLPLADLVGVTRQTTVMAYCFGDGFSNLAYPTNPVLLIVLGLGMVSYGKWLRWTYKIWFWVILASTGFLWVAVASHYGPF